MQEWNKHTKIGNLVQSNMTYYGGESSSPIH